VILPDELLDNFKYAITNEDIPMLEEAFRAGMLAAADMVTDSARGSRLDREGVANKIREATK